MSSPCVVCAKPVRERQHALECDTCLRWQHRLCGTDISIQDYRLMNRGELDIIFSCSDCKEKTEVLDPAEDRDIPMDLALEASLGPISRRSLPAISSPRSSTPQRSTSDLNFTAPDQSSITSPRSPTPPLSPHGQSAVIHTPPSESANHVLNNTYTIHQNTEQSFDVSADIDQNVPVIESDIEDDDHQDTLLSEQPVTYEIVEGGTKQRAMKLVSSDGFAYTVKKSTGSTTYWRCSVRSKALWCKATVSQRGDFFKPGPNPHQHAADPGLVKKTKIYAEVLKSAVAAPYQSAGDIVDEKMHDILSTNDFNLPKPPLLIRSANRLRQKMQPAEPRDINFDIDHDYLDDDDFFMGDVHVDSARHILFATRTQLNLLETARTWYVDGTFKVIRHPFTQLFSIHAFLQKDDFLKQVPLIFVLMSRRQKKDYDAVFQHVKTLVPEARVQSFTLDFEVAAWRSIADTFPGADIKGCSFHWSQAVMRKVANLGLRTTYYQRKTTHHFILKLLCLPYLPPAHIIPAFNNLSAAANTQPLKNLMVYLSKTWMHSSIWSVSQWSVFRQPVRTNNDTEGWHRRFVGKAGGNQLHFYRLVPALKKEAESVTITMKLVEEQQLRRYQRDTYRRAQGRLNTLWDDYEAKKIKTSAFLSAAAELFATPIPADDE